MIFFNRRASSFHPPFLADIDPFYFLLFFFGGGIPVGCGTYPTDADDRCNGRMRDEADDFTINDFLSISCVGQH